MDFKRVVFNIDNNDDILQFTFSDFTPVWPILRWQLRIAEMQRPSGGVKPESQSVKPVSLWKHMLFCLRNRPGFSANTDIISIANYEGNPEVPNRMTLFLREMPELKKQEWLYSSRRRMFEGLPQTFSFDYFFYQAWLKSKLMFTSPDQHWEKELDGFLSQIRPVLESFIKPKAWNQIRAELSFINRVIPYYRRTLKTALQKAKPKFILVSEGNNGEWKQAVLFQVAKELNIPTGEVQHGVFNLGMKYGEKLALNPKLKSLKTNYQFVFGPFHATLTNAPVQCIPFGHYDLERATDIKPPSEPHQGFLRMMLVGEGIPPSSVDNGLLKHAYVALKVLQTPFQLTIRLHPSESPADKYAPFFEFPGTRYSQYTEESVNALLQKTDMVISHASTVVFEALYYNLPVLVLQDANTETYIPKGVGVPFQNHTELLYLMTRQDYPKAEGAEYWSREGVVVNFRQFWEKHIHS
ncbi:MAG: hypothetical protein FJ347_08295 [Sphingomonadales bacterium]|nr:hypothetical protein [Sphingomonadales bacterium]